MIADLAWRPVLRCDITYHPAAADAAAGSLLEDRLLLRRVDLGRVADAVARRLDGRRTLGQVLDEAQAETGAPPESVAHSFRSLLLMNVIDGAGPEIIAAVRRVRAGERPAPAVLPEAQFACSGSGDCCQSYSYGPLTEEDLRRLAALDQDGGIARALPHLAGEPFLEQQETRGGRYQFYLRSIEDRCVFLLPDRRCGLHAAFGPEAKPRLCRDYPLNILPTTTGLRVFNVGECACHATTCRSGPLLATQPERLLRLIPPDLDWERDLQHPVLHLGSLVPCDHGHFTRLQDALCEVCATGVGTAGQTLLAMWRLMQAFRDALGACPLAPGEPDRTVAEVLAQARRPEGLYGDPAPAEVQEGLCAIAEVAGDLLREIGFFLARVEGTGTQGAFRDTRRFADVAHIVRLVTGDRGGLMDWPLPEEYARIAGVPAEDPELDQVLRLSFRQQIFGARAVLGQRPVPALQRLVICYLITIFGGKVRAVQEGADRVRPADLSWGHMLAQRVLRQRECAQVFLQHEERTGQMAAAAAFGLGARGA